MNRFSDNPRAHRWLRMLSAASNLSASAVKALIERAEQRAWTRAPQPSVESAIEPRGLAPRSELQPVRVRLPSGRELHWQGVAREADLAALAAASRANEASSFEVLGRHAQALARLEQSQRRLLRRLAALEQQSDLTLLGALRGLAQLEQQVKATQAQARQQRTVLSGTRRAQRSGLAALTRTTRLQSFNAAVSTLEATAFGNKGAVLDETNLLLASVQWLGGNLEPVLRGLGWAGGSETSVAGWLGPLLGLALVSATVGQRQQERFISGEVTLTQQNLDDLVLPVVVFVALRDRIARGTRAEFERRTDIPATAVVVEGPVGVRVEARVSDSVLGVVALGLAARESVRVVWTVDTGAGGG
jgi:hypothetical protein